MWKLLAASVAGTSHLARNAVCQDAHAAAAVETAGGVVLVVVAADGAGRAAHADVGAGLACEVLTDLVRSDLREGLDPAAVDADTLAHWVGSARRAVLDEACRRECRPRDLASTVALAVVGETRSAFAQIGDGAVVVGGTDGPTPVFWPQAGEYANTTNFLTDDDFAANAMYEIRDGRVAEAAVLTDGLQRLALDYAARVAHPGFFAPLFARLAAAADPRDLAAGFRAFLDSPPVNARTDDDKTLILAVRERPPCHPRRP